MKIRFFCAVAAALILVFFIFVGHASLFRAATGLADEADEICRMLSDESRTEEGLERLPGLHRRFSDLRPFFAVFANDARIHEIDRALSRAQKLSGGGDLSPALEALSDLSSTLRELAETHRPTLENIL